MTQSIVDAPSNLTKPAVGLKPASATVLLLIQSPLIIIILVVLSSIELSSIVRLLSITISFKRLTSELPEFEIVKL